MENHHVIGTPPENSTVWWDMICQANQEQWGLLPVGDRLVLEHNARQIVKEQFAGMGGK